MSDKQTDFEEARLAALYALGLLDTEAEDGFDTLTDLAVGLTGTRMCAVSLVDRDRQWFKSNINIPADETPRDVAFCHHAIQGDEIFYVPNALEDDRFRDNPLVTGEPHIRGYAGVPIRESGGHKIGTLCVIHDEPIDLSVNDFERLTALARLVEERIAERARTRAADASTRQLAAIAQVQTQYIANLADANIAFGQLLSAALELTGSEYGFIGEILTDESGRFLKTHAITDISWDEETRQIYETHSKTGFEFRNLDTPFGYTIRTGDALITNNPSEHGESGGLPEGYPPLKAYMGIPLFSRGEFVAMIGIANRPGGFDPAIRQAIEPLLVTISNLVSAHRMERAREQAIADLNDSQRRYDLAVQGSASGVWELDVRQNTAFLSERLLDIVGRPETMPQMGSGQIDNSAEVLLGFVHPEDRERVETALNAHLFKKQPYQQEYRLRKPDGSFIIVRSRGQAEWDFEGKPVRMAGSIEDITASVELEKEKRRATERLLVVTELGGIGSWEVDMATGQPIWDEITCRIHEVPADFEPAMDEAINFYAPEARPVMTDAVQRGIQEGEPWDLELPFITAKGNRIWVRAVGRALFENGKVSKLIGSFQDVTERRAREEEVRTLSGRLGLALQVGKIGVFEMNLDDGSTWWDKGSHTMFGVDPEAAEDPFKIWENRIHPDDEPELREKLEAALREGAEYDAEYRIVLDDGRVRHIRSQALLREGLYGEKVFSGINFDLTSEVRAREEIERRRKEAEEANLAKSQFLANMSHEIRTPLNGVLGMTQLLRLTDLTDKQAGFVNTLENSGRALLDLIEDILDISKIEAGAVDLSNEPFDVAQTSRSVIDMVAGMAAEKSLDLSIEIDPKIPRKVLGDQKRIRQVLINLLGNAVKFTPSGSVSLEVSQLKPDWVRFVVRDTGPGIPADQCSHIFGRFAQVDGSATREHGGTGLGLAICSEIVELAGGDIGVESELGQGACFWFEIPLESADSWSSGAETRDLAAASQTARMSASGRILVADDVATNLIVATALLKGAGYEVETASNGQEAIDILANGRFDAVLMDIQMPVLSGDEAIRQIRESGAEYANIPIFAVTADATRGAREKYLASGANGYLAKPLDLAEVLAVLQPSGEERQANG
ncbi:PAS domain-containing protein [Maricaulis sp.]|uniref:PAS domain-containing protein n=1 Tax=Maricaulis sp. TaxID=1486257 RepID=UPI001AFE8DAC|nr:PAS domain-containing protein [Maricaulis sp.]MBO6797568.1 PAS domain-containing protein [Maricaulis sp.]